MSNNKEAAFDLQMALKQVDNDQEMLKEIINVLLEEYPKQLNQIREYIKKNDAAMIRQTAHTIKGAVSNFGAKPAFEAAFHLEKIGENGDLSGAENAFTALKVELERLEQELKKIQ
jgi:HPt (histidine-containing phosphotransfer) domain-containing protein